MEQLTKTNHQDYGKWAEKIPNKNYCKVYVEIEECEKPTDRIDLNYLSPEPSETTEDQTYRAEREARNRQVILAYIEEVQREKPNVIQSIMD